MVGVENGQAEERARINWGDLRGSAVYMAWVRDAKRIKIQQKRVRELRADRNGLAVAWNGRTIRQGEAVAIWNEDEEGQDIKRARHWQVTTWPVAVLRNAWEEMDGRRTRGSGLGACTHG